MCLLLLGGCATAPKLGDSAATEPGGTAADAYAAVTPAEAAGAGAPEDAAAKLAKPGLLGSDSHDHLSLAKKEFRASNYGLAEQHYRKAVEEHPKDAEAWLGLAAANDRLRRFDLADRAYKEATRLIGPTPELLNNQGYSYLLRGDYARARQTLRKAQARDPLNPYITNNLKLLEKVARTAKAVE
jgi:Flp pilus assembly protein TadD